MWVRSVPQMEPTAKTRTRNDTIGWTALILLAVFSLVLFVVPMIF